VPVVIDRLWAPECRDHVIEHVQVASGILLGTKHRCRHPAGRIIDGGKQAEPWPPLRQPGMVAGIELAQHPGLRLAFSTLAVGWGTALARAFQSRPHPDAPHRGTRDDDPLLLAQHLGQVRVVEPRVDRLGERCDPGAQHRVERVDRCPSPVAMSQGGGALLSIRRQHPAHLPHRQPECRGRFNAGQIAHQHPVQAHQSLLFSTVQTYCLPHRGDRIAERLRVTLSQTNDSFLVNPPAMSIFSCPQIVGNRGPWWPGKVIQTARFLPVAKATPPSGVGASFNLV
jgi:hypothetical protein